MGIMHASRNEVITKTILVLASCSLFDLISYGGPSQKFDFCMFNIGRLLWAETCSSSALFCTSLLSKFTAWQYSVGH